MSETSVPAEAIEAAAKRNHPFWSAYKQGQKNRLKGEAELSICAALPAIEKSVRQERDEELRKRLLSIEVVEMFIKRRDPLVSNYTEAAQMKCAVDARRDIEALRDAIFEDQGEGAMRPTSPEEWQACLKREVDRWAAEVTRVEGERDSTYAHLRAVIENCKTMDAEAIRHQLVGLLPESANQGEGEQ